MWLMVDLFVIFVIFVIFCIEYLDIYYTELRKKQHQETLKTEKKPKITHYQ